MPQTPIHVGHYGGSSTSEQAIGAAVGSGHTWQVKAWVTNRTGAAKTFRLRQAYAGAAAANDQYRAYDAVVPSTDIVVLPIFTMVATDALYFTQSADGLTCIVEALDLT